MLKCTVKEINQYYGTTVKSNSAKIYGTEGVLYISQISTYKTEKSKTLTYVVICFNIWNLFIKMYNTAKKDNLLLFIIILIIFMHDML